MIRELLKRDLAELVPVSEEQLDRLVTHYQLLVRWNERLNLTRVIQPAAASRKHYCESALVARVLPAGPLSVADFGSGAGFPGLPVAVLRPDLRVTLIESHQRKAVFLREATRSVPNVTVAGSRGETFARHSFDWVVSRAVRWRDVLGAEIGRNIAMLLSAADVEEVMKVAHFEWSALPGIDPEDRLVIGRKTP